MNGQKKGVEEPAEKDFEETGEISMDATIQTDNVGDASVEFNVDELISEMEAAGLPTDHFEAHAARKRLDDILEEKRMSKEICDFEDFEID
jgi:hypothetical protein